MQLKFSLAFENVTMVLEFIAEQFGSPMGKAG